MTLPNITLAYRDAVGRGYPHHHFRVEINIRQTRRGSDRAWNVGRQVGVKKPLKQRQIWAVRFFLDRAGRMRDRTLFGLAIDSKFRGCDLVKIKIRTLVTGQEIRTRSMVVQQKTG